MNGLRKNSRQNNRVAYLMTIGCSILVAIFSSQADEIRQVQFDRLTSFIPLSDKATDSAFTYPLNNSDGLTFVFAHLFSSESNVYACFQTVQSRAPFKTGGRIDVFSVLPRLEKLHTIELGSTSRLLAYGPYAFEKYDTYNPRQNQFKIINLLNKNEYVYTLPPPDDVNGGVSYFSPGTIILQDRIAVIHRLFIKDGRSSSYSQCKLVDFIEKKEVAQSSHKYLSSSAYDLSEPRRYHIRPSPSGNSFIAGSVIFSAKDGSSIWSLPQKLKSKWFAMGWLDSERVVVEGLEEGVLSEITANLGVETSKLLGENTATNLKRTDNIELRLFSIVNLKTAEARTKAFPVSGNSGSLTRPPLPILDGKYIVSGAKILSTESLEYLSTPVPFGVLNGPVYEAFNGGTIIATRAGLFRIIESSNSDRKF